MLDILYTVLLGLLVGILLRLWFIENHPDIIEKIQRAIWEFFRGL